MPEDQGPVQVSRGEVVPVFAVGCDFGGAFERAERSEFMRVVEERGVVLVGEGVEAEYRVAFEVEALWERRVGLAHGLHCR